MSNTFQINDITLRYERAFFNEAYQNERSVEVALGRWFLSRFSSVDKPVLEVGAVMPYYGVDSHEIIDLADEHPRSKKVNALDYDYAGRNVLSISTIEHMMTKEYGNGSDADSYTFLTKMIGSASNYLVTWAIDYNHHLDAFMRFNRNVPRFILRRTNWKNEWVKQIDSNDFTSSPFGHSDKPIPQGFFNNANAICVATNLPELL